MRNLCTGLALVGAIAVAPTAASGQSFSGSRITASTGLASTELTWPETSPSLRSRTDLHSSFASHLEGKSGNVRPRKHPAKRTGLPGSGTLQPPYFASPVTRLTALGTYVPVISHDESASTPRMPFFLMGAAVGGGITALLLYEGTRSSDCTICHPITLSPLVVAGGLVGGLGGLVVHGWVVESRQGRVATGVALSW